MDEQDLRQQAQKSLKRKRDFRNFVFIWIVVNGMLTAIWAMSGGGYFWPMWAMFGMGIGLVFSWWDAYGPGNGGPTEDQIQSEMRKISGQ